MKVRTEISVADFHRSPADVMALARKTGGVNIVDDYGRTRMSIAIPKPKWTTARAEAWCRAYGVYVVFSGEDRCYKAQTRWSAGRPSIKAYGKTFCGAVLSLKRKLKEAGK